MRLTRSSLKRRLAALLLLSLAWPMAAVAAEAGPLRTRPQAAVASLQARVIVKLRADASVLRSSVQSDSSSAQAQHAAALGKRTGLTLTDGRTLGARTQVMRASGLDSTTLAKRLAADSDVEWAVVDHRQFISAAPNDPLYAADQTTTTPVVGQWYLRAPSGAVKSSIDIEAAWALTTGNASLVVAVLDTGIRAEHPDLTAKILAGHDFVGYSGDASVATANDGDAADDDPTDPGDWITSGENAAGEFKGCGQSSSSWHGTQTAGLIAASTDNALGMAGAGRDVKLLPVRVLGKCGGYVSDIVAGMRWAAGLSVTGVPTNTHPARVINLSLGGTGTCSAAYQDVVTELTALGVVVVAAAGNEGDAVDMPGNCTGVVGVAGVRHVGTKVGYSNLGPEITISAPAGNCVNSGTPCLYPLLTTTNTGSTTPGASTYSDSVNYSVGTSFSSPLVAGTVALMLSATPGLTPAQVIAALKATARPFPTSGGDSGTSTCHAPTGVAQDSECYCTTSTCGAGLLDAGAAVAAVLADEARFTISPSAPVAGAAVTLDGSASTVPAGRSISSYLWEITAGGTLARFTSATNAATATLDTLGSGTVTVRLTITDSAGANAIASQSLSISASGLTAAIGASSTSPEVGDVLTLSAADSVADSGRSIVAWEWAITSGSSLARFTSATSAQTATLEALAAGTVVVQLTVTDSAGLQASTTRSLSLANPAQASSGGGGALAPGWGLGLLLLVLGLGRRTRPDRR
jgi:serine protease